MVQNSCFNVEVSVACDHEQQAYASYTFENSSVRCYQRMRSSTQCKYGDTFFELLQAANALLQQIYKPHRDLLSAHHQELDGPAPLTAASPKAAQFLQTPLLLQRA